MVENVDYPRDLRIEENMAEEYERLVSRSSSPFHGAEKSDIFLLAAAVGWHTRRRQSIENRYVLVNRSALSDREQWILKSIAIADYGDAEILRNGRETIRIAEQYANGGIHEIMELRQGPEDLIRSLTDRMIQMKANDELTLDGL